MISCGGYIKTEEIDRAEVVCKKYGSSLRTVTALEFLVKSCFAECKDNQVDMIKLECE